MFPLLSHNKAVQCRRQLSLNPRGASRTRQCKSASWSRWRSHAMHPVSRLESCCMGIGVVVANSSHHCDRSVGRHHRCGSRRHCCRPRGSTSSLEDPIPRWELRCAPCRPVWGLWGVVGEKVEKSGVKWLTVGNSGVLSLSGKAEASQRGGGRVCRSA